MKIRLKINIGKDTMIDSIIYADPEENRIIEFMKLCLKAQSSLKEVKQSNG